VNNKQTMGELYNLSVKFNKVSGATPINFNEVTMQSIELASLLTSIADLMAQLNLVGMTIEEFDEQFKSVGFIDMAGHLKVLQNMGVTVKEIEDAYEEWESGSDE